MQTAELEKKLKNSFKKEQDEKNCLNDVGIIPNGVEKKYEMVNHPSHYNRYDVEAIEMMRSIWGDKETEIFCKLTAFKYRMRMGTKPGNSLQQDLDKENFYLNYMNKLRRK